MRNYRYISIILIFSLIFTNLIPASQALAVSPIAFGEIKAAGSVQIETSTGKWVEMRNVYPLLKNTKLRTGDGVVSIITRDGSRIDLSRNAEIAIDILNKTYNINLPKGTLSFNITPPESITVITPHVTVSAVTNPANIQGMVLCSDKGTEVRSISGRININQPGVQTKTINSGESLFAFSATSGEAATATVPAAGTVAGVEIPVLIAGGLVVTGGIVIAVEAFREEEVASPSGFQF